MRTAVVVAVFLAAFFAGSPAARADDGFVPGVGPAAEEFERQRFELSGGKIYRNAVEIEPTRFFSEIGRDDLAKLVKDEQGSGVGPGIGVGVGGLVAAVAGWGSFVGFTVYAAANGAQDPSILEWAVPAGILSAFAGSCLCPIGLAGGGLIAGLPYLEEKWPVPAEEMSRLVEDYNEKLRARSGLTSAMRF